MSADATICSRCGHLLYRATPPPPPPTQNELQADLRLLQARFDSLYRAWEHTSQAERDSRLQIGQLEDALDARRWWQR